MTNRTPKRSSTPVRPQPKRQDVEDEDADPVGPAPEPPRLEHVENAAEKVDQTAEEPAERTAELLHQELELTEAGVTSPEEAPPPSR